MAPQAFPRPVLRNAIQAAQRGDPAALAAALAAAPAVARHPDVLMKACSFGHVALVELLLDAGADPNLHAGDLGRPLDRTCCICSQTAWSPGHEATVRLLLARGADLRGRGRHGLTALGAAAWHHDSAAVALLRELGADQDLELDEAAALGDLDRVAALLAADATAADRANPGGRRPLQIVSGSRWYRTGETVHRRLADIAALLLAHDAPLAHPADGEHGQPLWLACSTGGPLVARVLLAHDGADTRAAFRPLVMHNRPDLLDLVPPAHWDVNGVGDPRCGNHYLGESCRWGQLRSAAWLLEHGADPNLPDHHGWTPLHYAARRGVNATILTALVDRGADLDARTAAGQTALDLARQHRRAPVIAALETAGRAHRGGLDAPPA